MTKAITLATQSSALTLRSIGQLLGDSETTYGGVGRYAAQLLDYARQGKLKTVNFMHERYGVAALVDADDFAAFIDKTGIGRGSLAHGWVRLKGSFTAL